jgi:hypothetical protein
VQFLFAINKCGFGEQVDVRCMYIELWELHGNWLAVWSSGIGEMGT